MQKTKRDKNETAYRFAERVVNTHGEFVSAQDAWSRMVNKKGVGMKNWEAFQSHLTHAVREGLLAKQRGVDRKGRQRMLYGPVGEKLVVFGTTDEVKTVNTTKVVEELLDSVRRTNRPSVVELSIGDLLDYNGMERGDFMSVLADLIYDTTLRDVRERYPTLEALVWDIVGGDA